VTTLCLQENIHRNFGMPQPNGYRKALRFMRHADKFGFPIITFVDTPGAYAGKNAEELGQVHSTTCERVQVKTILSASMSVMSAL
jgi:acetyl-CoA carboxylase alpha subunit